jgi:hypothetical protein
MKKFLTAICLGLLALLLCGCNRESDSGNKTIPDRVLEPEHFTPALEDIPDLIAAAFMDSGVSLPMFKIGVHIFWINLIRASGPVWTRERIAFIIPESPVKVMLSDDAGATWRTSVVPGSEGMSIFGEWHDNVQYYGGYIGTYGDMGGYLVLTAGTAMNSQPMRIYLTDDWGDTWKEIGNPNDIHASVLTGAGFASQDLGFISYRYYEDAGPDIWWTKDGGSTWNSCPLRFRLTIN